MGTAGALFKTADGNEVTYPIVVHCILKIIILFLNIVITIGVNKRI